MDAVRRGKLVIGNFPVNDDLLNKKKGGEYRYIPNNELTPKYLQDLSGYWFGNHKYKEGAIYLIIDECQLMFNARDWQQKGRNNWLSFFTQHRKLGIDVILICQFDRMIDRQIRSLIEYEHIHRKISNIGYMGLFFSLFFAGKLFVSVEHFYPLKMKVDSTFFPYKKKYGALYDTNYNFGG